MSMKRSESKQECIGSASFHPTHLPVALRVDVDVCVLEAEAEADLVRVLVAEDDEDRVRVAEDDSVGLAVALSTHGVQAASKVLRRTPPKQAVPAATVWTG